MSWRAWPFGKAPAPPPDAPLALLADIEKRGRQYLDEADNGKWVYPACKRTVVGYRRRQALGSAITRGWKPCATPSMVPRGEFRLLAEPDLQPAILEAYLRQLPHDETVIEFTGNTMSDLAIAVIAGFQLAQPLRRSCRRRPPKVFGNAEPLPQGCDVGAEMVGDEGCPVSATRNCYRRSRSRRCSCIWSGRTMAGWRTKSRRRGPGGGASSCAQSGGSLPVIAREARKSRRAAQAKHGFSPLRSQ